MSHRSKIWLTNDIYIYKSDFDWKKYCLAQKEKAKEISKEEIIESCPKYSHVYNQYKKGDTINVIFGMTYPRKAVPCKLLRVDYNFSETPEYLQVQLFEEKYRYVNHATVDLKSKICPDIVVN